MGKIRIVTDSSAQFSDPSIVRRYGITIVPQMVNVGALRYTEGVNLDPMNFHRVMSEAPGGTLPSHVAPSVEQFVNTYGALRRETDQILSIHLSKSISKTIDHAQEATRQYLGRCSITVLDSLSTSVGLGLLVEAAARLADTIESSEQLARYIRKRTQTLYAVFYTEAFDYLEKNEMLSSSHAALGGMLGIKPFVTIEEGHLSTMEKVRTRAQAIDKLVEFASEFDPSDRLFILHGGAGPNDAVRQLTERLAGELNHKNCPTLPYCPTLGTFIGPDALGIMVYQTPATAEF